MNSQSLDRKRFWLFAVFIASGFAGLIYQSIWSHYLGLFLGHAAYAQALVLAIFMGGMAAGAAWIAYAGQNWLNLVRIYALIELFIGVLAVLFHTIFNSTVSYTYDFILPQLGSPSLITFVRWVIAAALILPQTILLGMTFPLMSGGLIRRYPGSDGAILGTLYFTNSIGAAIGAVAAVFLLLPNFGMPGSMLIAGILNIVVACVAMVLARAPEPRVVVKNSVNSGFRHSPVLRSVLIGTALSGAASFIYEIVWIRMLSMAVGSTMHAFELMLASFIAGIAFGGLWIRHRASSTGSPLQLVGWMQVLMGIAALCSLAVYANSFAWVGWLMQSVSRSDGGYVLYNFGTAAAAIAIMLPAAFFAGTTLPLFTVSLLRDGHGERAIGRVYAWNTVGAIFGVFLAIHVLIPTFGLKWALIIGAGIDIIIGLYFLRPLVSILSRRNFTLATIIAAVGLGLAGQVRFDPLMLGSGVYRHGADTLSSSDKVIYYEDGKTASVSVVASPEAGTVRIATNGKVDASISLRQGVFPTSDEPTMAMAAALPLALSENVGRIGIIGFGSGLTTHTALADRRVLEVDTIEIEADMVAGAKAFGEKVARAYDDKRSNIIIDDAKSYFAGQNKKYNIIISEPSNPWISGIGSLFSKEFYGRVKKHLTDDGLFVQWIQLYEIDTDLVASVIKGVVSEFDDQAAWLTNTSDLLIVAKKKGSLGEVNPDFMQGELGKDLGLLGIPGIQHLKFRQVADRDLLRAFSLVSSKYPANSEYFPVLGLNAPKARFKGVAEDVISALPHSWILEGLGIRTPLAHQQVSFRSHFAAEALTYQARALKDVMLRKSDSPYLSTLPAHMSVAPARLLRAASNVCPAAQWSDREIGDVVKGISDLADLTMPYLSAQEVQGLWIAPTWWPCVSAPQELTTILRIYELLAMRNYKEAGIMAKNWLEGSRPVAYAQHFDSTAVVIAELAAVRSGDVEAVHQIGSQYGRLVLPHMQSAHRVLQAYAALPSKSMD